MKAKSLFAIFAALAVVACAKKEPTPEPDPTPEFTASLKVDKTDKISAEVTGKTVTLKVTANISWTATSDQSWATVSPASESITDQKSKETSTTVTIAENTGTDARTATITFKAEGASDVKISVEQAGVVLPDPVFALLDENLDPFAGDVAADKSAGSASLIINSNISWTASSDAEWLTVTPGSAEIKDYEEIPTAVTIAWEANKGAERSAAVSFIAEGVASVTVTVTQEAAPALTISVENITYQTADVTFTSSSTTDVYYYVLTAKATYDQAMGLGMTGSDLVKYFLHQNATGYEVSDAVYLAAVGKTETYTVNYKGLPDNTELIALACFFDADANPITEAASASFTTEAKPSVDPDYTALLGTYTFNAYDYFDEVPVTGGTFLVEEGVVNESYKISLPGTGWGPEQGQYIDHFECPWDKTGKKSFAIPQEALGDEGMTWNYGDLGNCGIKLDIFYASSEDPIEAVVLTADESGNLSATAPAIPQGDYVCFQSGIYNADGETDYANGIFIFDSGLNFTKQAVTVKSQSSNVITDKNGFTFFAPKDAKIMKANKANKALK